MGEGAVCVEMATDVNLEKENTSGTELVPDLACANEFLMDNVRQETFPDKKEAKEASNEDVKSEVSNPTDSSRENALSCQDISSQRAELMRSDQVGHGEETSTCSGSSCEEGQPSSENVSSHVGTPQNDSSDSVSVCHVVLEIPKHVSSSGIRKITFKFNKRKEDYGTQTVTSVPEYGRSYSTWIDSGGEVSEGMDRYACNPNMELKMSKKVVPHNYPSNVKKLLSTGILDGARVKYMSFSPARELDGIIDGGGYLCGCSMCNFSRVLSAYEFEQHAGFKTRHPNNHIYLENGRPIYSIIQEVKTAPLSMLDEVVKDVAGSSINEEFFQVWKASLQQTNETVGVDKGSHRKLPSVYSLLSHSNQALQESAWPASSSFLHNNLFKDTYMTTSEERKHALKRPSLFESGSVVKQRKTPEGGSKRRDNDLHRLLFMPNGLPDGADLAYYVKGHKILGGYKLGNGIVCNCCETEISPSQFEAHAGMAARRQPYRHIYTSNGVTLHDIAISLANGQSLTTSMSDDMCTKCGDGGNLICCETCPRAFHAACLGLQSVPKGSWCCPNCNKSSHGARPIIIRSTRVVKSPESEVGGCAICRGHDFRTETFGDRTVIYCDQCEKEFHVGCLRDRGQCDLKEVPREDWFCSDDCNRIHEALHESVNSGVQTIPPQLLDIINRKHSERGLLFDEVAGDIQWRILMGKSRIRRDLLSAATAIFRECFDPIVARSGRDLIPVMVYGRNISGQEFGNMYCILLIVKGTVVSAGLLRIFGRAVAELPLVATCREHQGKGYFQALFSSIERLLCFLNVENLVLPAAEEAESIWTNKFGFRKMSEGQLLRYTRDFQLTIFKGTSMLEKEVPKAMA
ncbi:hypothetical protein K2173_002059 [Erythroxylum novogranatense]|uniref:PHD-type domain-containing protein n=1 Tax=Erythroxylum novogranatense TaxID=1862640 RepID=A0AAV8SQ44_9ROSI|nr:hypothetical protein K2173_002059 [Erythroxylum novogranatense]